MFAAPNEKVGQGGTSRFSVDSIQAVPFLEDEIKKNPSLVKWAYQIVCTRAAETEDG